MFNQMPLVPSFFCLSEFSMVGQPYRGRRLNVCECHGVELIISVCVSHRQCQSVKDDRHVFEKGRFRLTIIVR